MGLFRSNSPYVDLPGMKAELSPAIALWFSGRVQIVDLNAGLIQRNPFTNLPSTGAVEQRTLIWEGPARISVEKTPKTKDIDPGYTDTFLSPIRVQVEMDYNSQSAIRKGFAVYVLDGGNEAQLQDFQYIIHQKLGASTNAIMTLECGVDAGAVGSFGPV